MPDYDGLRQTALRLISNFGSQRTVDVIRQTEGSYDPITDTETDPGEMSYTLPGVLVKRSDSEVFTAGDDLTFADTCKVYIPAIGATFKPLPGDMVTIPQEIDRYVVTDVYTARPDGDAIFHTLMCARATA